MSDKLKLLEQANKKVATDKDFFAFFLRQYLEIEQIDKEAILSMLNCDNETYNRLGLCKAPGITENDYLVRLNNIFSYLGISVIELNKIIKRVNTVIQLRESNTSNSYLMAARDKKKKDDNKDNLK